MALLNCGDKGDFWAEHALLCLPDDIRNEWDDRLTIICMAESDGRRLTRKSREGKEIIVLAERIVPSSSSNEDSADVRYFVFALLHEVAHAINDDPPPNECSKEENDAIEKRADNLAFQWFNSFLRTRRNSTAFTKEELNTAQKRAQFLMRKASLA
jgi:hypothetical protein